MAICSFYDILRWFPRSWFCEQDAEPELPCGSLIRRGQLRSARKGNTMRNKFTRRLLTR